MSKYQIKIEEPCHENWNTMTPNAQGKFCGSCAKDVVDFTAMSDKEVISYFENYKGSLCGRFNANQLERKDEGYYALSDFTKKFVRAFAMVFLMFTAFESAAQPSAKPIRIGAAVCVKTTVFSKGIVYGVDGAGISNATISLFQNGIRIKSTVTNRTGEYNIKIEEGRYELRITKQGFETVLSDIKVTNLGTFGDFELKPLRKLEVVPPPVMGMIKVMGRPSIKR